MTFPINNMAFPVFNTSNYRTPYSSLRSRFLHPGKEQKSDLIKNRFPLRTSAGESHQPEIHQTYLLKTNLYYIHYFPVVGFGVVELPVSL